MRDKFYKLMGEPATANIIMAIVAAVLLLAVLFIWIRLAIICA